MSTCHSKVAYSVAMSFSLALLGMVACGSEEVDAEDQGGGETGGVGTSTNPSSTVATGGTTFARGGGNATGGAGLGLGGNSSPKASSTNTAAAGTAGTKPLGSGGLLAAGGVTSAAGNSSTAPSCVSGRACTAGCTTTCLNNPSASYTCQCSEGKLDCDVRSCVQQVGGCEEGNTCSKDCTAACPGDAGASYTCTCSGGRLSCDTMSCLGDSVCPSMTSDGLVCDDTQTTCTPPAGSTETLCFCLLGTWLCL